MKKNEFDNFDEFATNYRDIHNANIKITGADSEYFSRYKIEIVKELFPNSDPEKILDFGCGDGLSLELFRNILPSSSLFGIDVSEESIEQANKKKIPDCETVAFDGANIPYADNSFSIVFTANVFHHINHKNHPGILKEIYRVLKPGGVFIIFEHNPYNPITRKIVNECEFDHDAVLLKPGYTRSSLKSAGFKSVTTDFTLFFPRSSFFKPFLSLEKRMRFIPIGGQYFGRGVK